ncbi:FosA family fosfomycin resistance glutathione transferase [Pseudomonas guariconensis]
MPYASPIVTMLTGLNHLTLAVTGLQASVDFYVGVLRFRLRAQWDTGAYLELGDLWLCLSLDKARSLVSAPDYTHYAFNIAQQDFARFVEHARSYGVKEWKSNRSEGDSFYFLDPDGHQLEAHVGSLESRLEQCRLRPYAGMQFFD